MRTLLILALWPVLGGTLRADYAEMRRNVGIKSDPQTSAAVTYQAAEGDLMPLLDNGVQTNGYYHVEYAPSQSGWVYRTMVRLHYGPVPGPVVEPVTPVIAETPGTGQIPANYYNTAGGLLGTQLRGALHSIIRGHTVVSYNGVWDALIETDRDPARPQNVLLIYPQRSQLATQRDRGTGFDYASHGYILNDSWNREHVWPKSHGFPEEGDTAFTDLHHLRPADRSVNSARNTRNFGFGADVYYDNGGTVETDCRYSPPPDYCWEPPDQVKGDIARMLFYMDLRYDGPDYDLELVESFVPNGSKDPELGKLSVLLQWHHDDPVDNLERTRNHIIYHEYQGNRNPFIDHPEWVGSIWGVPVP